MESIHGERGLRKPPPNPQRGWRSQAVTIAALTGMILTGWSLAAVAAGSATTAADVRANHKTDKKPAERWSVERANQWYAKYPWICGCNYVPSTAVNQLEMWQADTFDPKTIDHELGMAESIGLNTVRIFLHDQAWVQDPDGFKKRLSEFLDICQKHHIWALVTFFTNGGRGTPIKIGKQPEPIPGVHNARWLQSPGAAVVNHPEKWAYLEGYVKDILSTYAEDERILCWCLYNEPESTRNGNRCLPLLRTIWRWGRQVDPSQPFTAPIFFLPMHPRTDLRSVVSSERTATS